MDAAILIRPKRTEDGPWLAGLLESAWGSTRLVSRDRVHEGGDLQALIAECDGRRAGALTYRIDGAKCEIVTLNGLVEGRGVGTRLLEEAAAIARRAGCRRLWLVTTNDNVTALRFYQRRGFELAALHRGAMDRARRLLKPEIPAVGMHGIPIRDEIELEMAL